MCGRYALYGPVSRNNRRAIEFLEEELDWAPRYNAAPTQMLPVFRVTAHQGRSLTLLRWGLVPSWTKDSSGGAKLINARADTIGEKPAFRAAFRRRRCLVPMSGFYEWRKSGRGKVPHFVHLLNVEIFAAAGIYEYWRGKDGGEPVESYAIITTDANDIMRPLHDRMPAILERSDYAAWLDPENDKTDALKDMLKPYPAEEMRAYPVSLRVNDVRNDGPELIEPSEPAV